MRQRHLFKSVLEFLTRGGSAQPMVMLFDDLHWADESSLLLLEHIAPRLGELPMLMIGTYRDVQADIGKPFARTLATLVRQRLVERISVDPFDETSVADILTALGGSPPPAGLAHAIHEATEGNVFFIEETFRHLSEEGLLFEEDGGWRSDIDFEHLDVPEGVRLVTARRLERLSEPTRKVLAMAAMIGLRFSIPVLEAASPDPEVVLDAIEEAEAAHLLKPATGGRELRYEFVHALARQTLLGELSLLRQRRMHLVIADAIEQTAAGQVERWAADLAHHLLEAGSSADPVRTVGWLKAAGDNAFAAAAMEEAAQYFDTALSLIGDEQKEIRADLLHRRGSARRSLGQLEGFLADLVAAFDVFETLGLGEKAAPIADDLSTILSWLARQDEAQALVSRGLALVPDEPSVSRCRLLSAQGSALSNAGEAAASVRAHQAAMAIARTLDSPRLLARVLQNQGWDGWHRFDGVAAERVAREAAAIHRELGQEWNLSQSLVVVQAGLTLTGRYDEAERINDELLPIAQRHEDIGVLAISAMMNGLIQQARGNIAESSRHIRRSADLFETGGLPWSPLIVASISVNALLAGDLDQARTAFESAAAKGVPRSAWSGADVGMALSGKARLGDPDTYSFFESLREQVSADGQIRAAGSVLLLLATIEALLLIGPDDEAALQYPAVRTFVASGCGVQTFTYGLTERFAGMAAAAARDWDAAETHFRNALDLAETLPHRVDQARVRYWFARALLDRHGPGDRDRAQQMLTEARALSEAMSLHGRTEWIDAQLAR
jgi:tetratricopeptide (TPR) repeat protein